MSTVDVVVPCYKYARYLPRAVESALNQDGVDVRVLILDDCSPDDTEEVGRRLAAADPRVTYRKNEKNLGLVGTANYGLFEWATADYAILLSSDDALHPGALAMAARLMDANPGVGLVYGLALVFDDDQEGVRAPDVDQPEQTIIPGERFIGLCCEMGNPVAAAAAIVRMSTQRQVGPYAADFPWTSDYHMWMRFAQVSDIGFVKATFGYYRWHGSNMSSVQYADARDDLLERIRTVKAVFEGDGRSAAEHERLLGIAKRRCGELALQSASGLYESGDAKLADACVSFAREQGVSILESKTWWKLQAKRALGRRVVSMLKSARPPTAEPKFIGFWPEMT